jgi:hypothetical protein
MDRRQFLKLAALTGVQLVGPGKWSLIRASARSVEPRVLASRRVLAVPAAQIAGGTLAPGDVDKYVLPLVKPPAMPKNQKGKKKGFDYYEIAVRQFQQRILSPPHPKTTVWSYGSVDYPGTVAEGGTFNYPAFTIEAAHNRPVRVNWINDLVAKNGKFLPHLLAVTAPTRTPTATATPRPGTCQTPRTPPRTTQERELSTTISRRSSSSEPGRVGIPAPRCSSTATTSPRPRCGTMTTRWA